MSKRSCTAEHRNHSTRLANTEDGLTPLDAPLLVSNDVLPVPLVPVLISHCPSKAAAVGDVLHERRAVLDAIEAARNLSVVPFSSDEFIVIRRIGDTARDRILRERLENAAAITQNNLIRC